MEDMYGEDSKRKPLLLYWLHEIIGEHKGLVGLLHKRGKLGDIYAVSVPGKMITMIFSLSGITFDALPASLITAGFMQELQQK